MGNTLVSQEVLDCLVAQDRAKQESSGAVRFVTNYGFLELVLRASEILPNKPSIMKTSAEVDDFVMQSRDFLEFAEFYSYVKRLAHEYPHKNQKLLEPDEEDVLDKLVGRLSKQELEEIYMEYSRFLNGERGWVHKKVADQYRIDVVTLRKYLKAMGIYDSKKHYAKNKK